MRKRDMATRIASETGLKFDIVFEVIQKTFDTITGELSKGNSLEFRDFGVFSLEVRKARIGRNPRKAKTPIVIPEHVAVKFKPGKTLKENLKTLKTQDIVFKD